MYYNVDRYALRIWDNDHILYRNKTCDFWQMP